MLRHDQVNKESSEVTYVNIDSMKVTGGVEFEVYKNNDMVLSSMWVSRVEGGCLAQWKCGGIEERFKNGVELGVEIEL
ncbi:hypothetical protein ACFX1T_012878 [Malus domestica]